MSLAISRKLVDEIGKSFTPYILSFTETKAMPQKRGVDQLVRFSEPVEQSNTLYRCLLNKRRGRKLHFSSSHEHLH